MQVRFGIIAKRKDAELMDGRGSQGDRRWHKITRSNTFVIEATWDNDAEVWVAECDSVPGLITEADSRTHLIEKLTVLIPELLELNNHPIDPDEQLDITLRLHREAE
jgi:predicted RNase H-like HicB family nuclease